MSLIKDLVHEGGKIPGVHFALHTGWKTLEDLAQVVEQSPAGLYHLGSTAIHHPEQLDDIAKQMGKAFVQDLRHPLRNPGYTLLDVAGLLPVIGAPLKAAEIGGIIARGGALPKWAEEAAAARGLESGTAPIIPKGTLNRMVDPITGTPRSTSSQVLSTIFRGSPREARPLKIPTAADLPGNEAFDTPNGVVQYGWFYSKDPIIKAAQKMVDKMYDTHPEILGAPIWRVAPPFWRSQSARLRSAARAEQLAVKKEASTKGAAYLKKYKDMSPEDWLTNRMVLEGTLPQDLFKMHQDALASGELTGKQLQETKRRMELIPKVAAERLDTRTITNPDTGATHDVTILRPSYAEANPKMVEFINDSRTLSHERDYASIVAGVLHPDSALGRRVAPYEFSKTGKLPVAIRKLNMSLGQLRLNPVRNKKKIADLEKQLAEAHGQMNLFDPAEGTSIFKTPEERQYFAEQAQLARVPYAFDRDPFLKVGAYNVFRRSYRGGKPRVPSTYTNPFTASIMRTGGGAENTARLLAESYTEAQRYIGLKAISERLQKSAVLTPESIPEDDRQLIRLTTKIPNVVGQREAERLARGEGLPKMEQTVLNKEGDLTPHELIGGARLFEGVRKFFFPEHRNKSDAELMSELGIEDRSVLDKLLGRGKDQKFYPVAGYGWVNKSQLGDLHKTNPLVGLYERPIARKAIKTIDFANSTLKSMMLFLRPAYLLPNLIGNIALNLIQQGAFAPFHMMKNWLTWHGLTKAERSMVDANMGKGIAGSTFFEKGRGGFSEAPQRFAEKAGRVYGWFMDDPFRRNAFLHEAATQGFDSPARVRALMTNPKYTDELRDITTAANDEIISYDRLGPGEEQLMRRLILFYPFTKGASRYAVNLPKTHPLAAGGIGSTGQEGQRYVEEMFGPNKLPPYMAGIIPTAGLGGGLFKTLNPASTSPLAEPAMLLNQILNLGSAHPNKYLALTQNLAPVDAAALGLLSGGQTNIIGRAPGQSLPESSLGALTGGLPPISLWNVLHGRSAVGGDPSLSVYPDTNQRNAILRYLIGGGLGPPRVANIPLAQYREWLAEQGR